MESIILVSYRPSLVLDFVEGEGVGEGGPQFHGSDNLCELNDLPKARIVVNKVTMGA